MKKLQTLAAALFGLSCLACSGLPTASAPAAPQIEAPAPAPSPGSSRDRGGRKGSGRRGSTRGGGSAPSTPAVDSPAFKTFETADGKYRVVFTSDSQLKKTWANMTGSAVEGSWDQSGDTVEVKYVPASHHGSSAETFVTRGECSLIRTVRVDAKSGERIESPTTYVLDEPRCH